MCVEVVDGVPTRDMRLDPVVIDAALQAHQAARAGPMTAGFSSVAFMPLVDFLAAEGQKKLSQLLDEHFVNTDIQNSFPSQEVQYSCIRSILQNPDERSVVLGGGGLAVPPREICQQRHLPHY